MAIILPVREHLRDGMGTLNNANGSIWERATNA